VKGAELINMKTKKINVAVIGCGYWGPNIVRNLFEINNCKVIYACDSDKNRLKIIKNRYPSIKAITNYGPILEDKDVNAIVVVTPVSTHYQIARDSLKAGKHVLIEKPITDSSRKAKELIRLAGRNGRVLMVGHTFIYNPAVRKIKELLAKKDFGKIYYIDSTRVNLGLHQSDISVLWDLGPHDISMILYLLNDTPQTVMAVGKSYIQKDVQDAVFLMIEFTHNIIAHIHISWLAPSKIRQTVIIGSRKMLIYNDAESVEKIKIFDKGVTLPEAKNYRKFLPEYRVGDVISPQVETTEPLQLECRHFIDCILKNKRPETDGINGLNVVKILEAAEKSLKNNGGIVRLTKSLNQ